MCVTPDQKRADQCVNVAARAVSFIQDTSLAVASSYRRHYHGAHDRPRAAWSRHLNTAITDKASLRVPLKVARVCRLLRELDVAGYVNAVARPLSSGSPLDLQAGWAHIITARCLPTPSHAFEEVHFVGPRRGFSTGLFSCGSFPSRSLPNDVSVWFNFALL